jgi:DNA-binding NarL/FixJ family response regulator
MHKLAPRQKEVLSLVIEGLSDEAIATELGLKLGTITGYVVRIKDILNGGSERWSREQLIAYARRHDIGGKDGT